MKEQKNKLLMKVDQIIDLNVNSNSGAGDKSFVDVNTLLSQRAQHYKP